MRVRTALGATVAGILAAVVGVAGPTAAQPGTPSAGPEVRLTGTLHTTVVEPRPGDRPRVATQGPAHAALRVQGRLVPVETAPVADIEPGSTVTLDVVVPDTVDEDTTTSATDLAEATATHATEPGTPPLEVSEVVSTRAATASADTAGTRALTVVRVTPKGTTKAPPSASAITAQVAAADRFWRDNSRGTVGLRLAATPPAYRSLHTCDDPFAMWEEAARRTDYADTPSTSLVLVLPMDLPDSLGCSYGQATIGDGLSSSGYAYVQGSSADVLAHEVGHNMSLQHSNLLTCTSKAHDAPITRGWWPSGCTEWEYGDGQDIMSADLLDYSTQPPGNPGSPMLSTPQARRLGLLEPEAVQTVPAGQTTRLSLRPLSGGTGVRGATLVNEVTGVRYWIEYRNRLGRDEFNAMEQTTGVRVLRLGPNGTTVLLDPTPTGTFDLGQALGAGRSVKTYDGHLTVTTVAQRSDWAVVDITSVSPGTFYVAAAPTLSGTRGVGRTLTVQHGTWYPTPTRYTYRWHRGPTPIAGATGRTYTPVRADAGTTLRVQVTAHRSGSTSATSWAWATIPIHNTQRPKIGGTPRAGRTLTAYTGWWLPTPTSYRVQWYRGWTPITGATSRTYKLTARDVGQQMRVRVVAKRAGSVDGAAMTLPTKRVTR